MFFNELLRFELSESFLFASLDVAVVLTDKIFSLTYEFLKNIKNFTENTRECFVILRLKKVKMEDDSVKVFLRLRPNKLNEVASPHSAAGKFIEYDKSSDKMLIVDKSPYLFDHIFYPSSTQRNVFETMVSGIG